MTQPQPITINTDRWKAQYEFPCEVSIDAVVQRLLERHPQCASMVIVAMGQWASGHTQALRPSGPSGGIPERLTKS
jgi:hypothetical protein